MFVVKKAEWFSPHEEVDVRVRSYAAADRRRREIEDEEPEMRVWIEDERDRASLTLF